MHGYADDPVPTLSEIKNALALGSGPAIGGFIREQRAARREEERKAVVEGTRIAKIALALGAISLAVSLGQAVASLWH